MDTRNNPVEIYHSAAPTVSYFMQTINNLDILFTILCQGHLQFSKTETPILTGSVKTSNVMICFRTVLESLTVDGCKSQSLIHLRTKTCYSLDR